MLACAVAARASALDEQLAGIDQRIAGAEATGRAARQQQLAIEETLPLAEGQLAARQELARRGLAPRLLVLREEERVVGLRREAQARAAEAQQANAEAAMLRRERSQAIQEFRAQAAAERAEAEAIVATRAEAVRRAEFRFGYQQLVAPVDGIVNEIAVTTLGEVVEAGAPLITIVPTAPACVDAPEAENCGESDLIVEAMVLNRDVGFVRPGQRVTIKLEAFPFTRHGALEGVVIDGEVEEGRRYTEADFNRIIEIKQREAYRVKTFMEMIDQGQKTIVFCATQDHAAAVRDLINQMKTSSDPNYCVRVTAHDGAQGDQWLRTFQDNEKTIPTILTTSQKLSTGVDARNVRNIVLMRPINSMIEFKQIVGRGTRLYDGKDYFTIYDFVKAHLLFADPEWDGEPIDPEPPGEPRGPRVPQPPGAPLPPVEPEPRPQRIKIKLADGKERNLQHISATMFYSPDGRPLSAAEFVERLFGELPALFKDEAELARLWGDPATRRALLESLSERGYGAEQLGEIRCMIDAEKSDIFDVLAYIAFALAPVTRAERVERRRNAIFAQYDDRLQTFLDFVLAQYVKEGVSELDQEKLPDLLVLKYRGIADATAALGGDAKRIREAFVGFQRELYRGDGA